MKSGSAKTALRFERRDLLKIAAGMPVAAALASAPYAAGAATFQAFSPGAPGDATRPYPRILNAQEWQTLKILADWIVPADSVTGNASEAGVPEFIDDWLGLKGGFLLDQIRGGLAWLDQKCRRVYGEAFAHCSRARQRQMLDRIAYPAKAAPADAAGVAFFNRLRDLVVSGFYTSRMGMRDLPYLGNEPQAGWTGCPPAVIARLGLKKSSRS